MHSHTKVALHHAQQEQILHEGMENPNATSAIPYLVSTNQMDHDEDIGNVDEPVWVEESEARCHQRQHTQ